MLSTKLVWICGEPIIISINNAAQFPNIRWVIGEPLCIYDYTNKCTAFWFGGM